MTSTHYPNPSFFIEGWENMLRTTIREFL